MYSERFNKAYNALVDAYFNGTLAKCHCAACAVGNIVAYCMGVKLKADKIYFGSKHPNTVWVYAVNSTSVMGGVSSCEANFGKQYTENQLFNLTGYTSAELAHIEDAFESCTEITIWNYPNHTEQEILEDQFNGLCAVVDVLLSFEENQEVGTLKTKFREHPKLQLA